ncbi:3-oxoacid CoA-transferase subunit B [Burkholderia sp. AW33-5]
MKHWTRQRIAQHAARDIPHGAHVNLGIGLPTLIGDELVQDREIFLHSENGILHLGPRPPSGLEDVDLINASKQAVSLQAGASIFDSALSFAMMRGGHLDLAILGAYEVAENGDLANWTRADPNQQPAVGGAMELAFGAREVWVLMEHVTRDGRPRLLRECHLPLTARGVVKRIYTDLAILRVERDGLRVEQIVDGLTLDQLRSLTEAKLLT